MAREIKTVTREVQVEVWRCASCGKEEDERPYQGALNYMGGRNTPPYGWFTLTHHLYNPSRNSADKTFHFCTKRCIDRFIEGYKP